MTHLSVELYVRASLVVTWRYVATIAQVLLDINLVSSSPRAKDLMGRHSSRNEERRGNIEEINSAKPVNKGNIEENLRRDMGRN